MGELREVSGTITGEVFGYVRRERGAAGVRELLSAAGEHRSIEELEDATSWGSYVAALRLFEAADALLGGPDVARRIGVHVLDQHVGTEVATILRSLGTAEEVL
jgi:hypothetical protein